MFPKEILLCIFQVCIAIAIMHFAQAEAQAGRSFKHEDREDTFPNIGCHAVTCEKNGSLVIRAHCASSPDCASVAVIPPLRDTTMEHDSVFALTDERKVCPVPIKKMSSESR